MQLVWLKEPYDQNTHPVLTVGPNGGSRTHDVYGGDRGTNHDFDLLICKEQPANLDKLAHGIYGPLLEYLRKLKVDEGHK